MILEEFKLTDKIAIVTGCSRPNGIGFAIAEALAEAGANIAGVGVSDMSIIKKHIEKIGKHVYPALVNGIAARTFHIVLGKVV